MIKSEKQLKRDKRAYIAYFNYLQQKEAEGYKDVQGISISEELHESKFHIDNIDLTLQKLHHEQETP